MAATARTREGWETLFAGAAGLFLALALLKFGNPVILDHRIPTPSTLEDFIYAPWPVVWGQWMLAGLGVLGLLVARWTLPAPRWVPGLLALWLVWQFVAASQTIDGTLTGQTLRHFVACGVCFALGMFALSQVRQMRVFWLALLGGFFVVLAVGLEQHFGGLERTRRFFYELPNWRSYPPDFLKKVESNRIYGTLVYANAFAGVILILAPILLSQLWRRGADWGRSVRWAAVSMAAGAALACLYWSGSKAGWLIAVGQGVVALLHSSLARRWKAIIVTGLIMAGIGGFALKYAGYFQRGATSVSARLDYWQAAATTLAERPMLGSGPGTFIRNYQRLKPPEAEMTRLVHNDYLQQGSDSGSVGMLAYIGFVMALMALLYRNRNSTTDGLGGVWLGLAGFAAQGLVEFGLYIPALSWTFFLLAGWAWGRNRIDKPKATS